MSTKISISEFFSSAKAIILKGNGEGETALKQRYDASETNGALKSSVNYVHDMLKFVKDAVTEKMTPQQAMTAIESRLSNAIIFFNNNYESNGREGAKKALKSAVDKIAELEAKLKALETPAKKDAPKTDNKKKS